MSAKGEPDNKPGDLVYVYRNEDNGPTMRRIKIGHIYCYRGEWRWRVKGLTGHFLDKYTDADWGAFLNKVGDRMQLDQRNAEQKNRAA
jgi:hypothetical protein